RQCGSPARRVRPAGEAQRCTEGLSGLGSFPGGHVERGEEFEEALHLELREEIGIVPVECHPLAPITDPHVATTAYRMYAVTAWHGEAEILDQEHSELRWVPLNVATSLPDLALEAYRPP